MNESTREKRPVGTRVIDTEDTEPDVGIVVWRPPEKTVADWEYQREGQTVTAAETNPEYPPDTQLVVIAFEPALDAYWEDWKDAAPPELFAGVREHEVHHYGFPEPRLAPTTKPGSDGQKNEVTTDQERDPPLEEFALMMECLEQNEFTVVYDAGKQVLRVEKFGVEHTIAHDGTVEGEGRSKGRVEAIVNRFL